MFSSNLVVLCILLAIGNSHISKYILVKLYFEPTVGFGQFGFWLSLSYKEGVNVHYKNPQLGTASTLDSK